MEDDKITNIFDDIDDIKVNQEINKIDKELNKLNEEIKLPKLSIELVNELNNSNKNDKEFELTKFRTPADLIKAYAALEVEFTKRSQKLKQLEGELNNFKQQNLNEKVGDKGAQIETYTTEKNDAKNEISSNDLTLIETEVKQSETLNKTTEMPKENTNKPTLQQELEEVRKMLFAQRNQNNAQIGDVSTNEPLKDVKNEVQEVARAEDKVSQKELQITLEKYQGNLETTQKTELQITAEIKQQIIDDYLKTALKQQAPIFITSTARASNNNTNPSLKTFEDAKNETLKILS